MSVARIALALALLLAMPAVAGAGEVAIFRDWVRAFCIATAAGDTPFGRDAAASAGAQVEKGHLPAEAYEAGEALVRTALARPVTGTRDVRYDTLKCLDLAESREVGRLALRTGGRKGRD